MTMRKQSKKEYKHTLINQFLLLNITVNWDYVARLMHLELLTKSLQKLRRVLIRLHYNRKHHGHKSTSKMLVSNDGLFKKAEPKAALFKQEISDLAGIKFLKKIFKANNELV